MHLKTSFFLIFLFFLSYSLFGQNTLSIKGGISNSAIPLYTTKENAGLLTTQSINKLSFSAGYNYRYNSYFVIKSNLAFKNLGIRSLNKEFDQEDSFVNSVSLDYLVLSILPHLEIRIGKYTLAGGLGPSTSLLLNERVENYTVRVGGFDFLDKENLGLKRLEAGITGILELNRIVANDFKVILSIEKYQGLINVYPLNPSGNNVFLSNASLHLGLEIPLKKKKA